MLLPKRHGSVDSYRYGFQGQEKDDEIKGEGNSINFTFRMYDPRVGRFFAVDPLSPKYPFYTPYSFAGNKVLQFIELEGLEEAENRLSFGEQIEAGWNAFLGFFGDRDVVKKVVEKANEIGDFDNADKIQHIQKQADTKQIKSVVGMAEIAGELYGSGEIARLYMYHVEGKDVYSLFNEYGSLNDNYSPSEDRIWGAIGIIPGVDELKNIKHLKKLKHGDKVVKTVGRVADALKTPSKKLRKALGLKVGDPRQAHHLIPTTLLERNRYIQDAVEEGFDFNGIANGLPLGLDQHSGRHPEKTFIKGVEAMINAAKNERPKASPKQVLEAVSETLREMLDGTGIKVNDLFKEKL